MQEKHQKTLAKQPACNGSNGFLLEPRCCLADTLVLTSLCQVLLRVSTTAAMEDVEIRVELPRSNSSRAFCRLLTLYEPNVALQVLSL